MFSSFFSFPIPNDRLYRPSGTLKLRPLEQLKPRINGTSSYAYQFFCDISYLILPEPLGRWPWWVVLVLWAGRQTDFRCGCDNSLRGCLREKGLCIGRLCGQVGCIDHARREWIFANNELVVMEYHRLYPSRLLHHTPPRCRLCQIAIIQQGGL